MARGLRNNNPGNIRHSSENWQGEIPTMDKSFKAFKTMAYGYRAMFVLINNYQKKYGLKTITEIINRWAPPNENDTTNYCKCVSEWSGVPATSKITTTNREVIVPIVAAMSRMENGTPAVMRDVEAGYKLFIG